MQLIELVKINELLSILSGRLSATLNRHLNKKFKAAELEITTEQWLVLVCLWNKDKLTQQAISERTFKDKASITRLLDTLSRHDLIERHSEPTDRRINLIHLTEKGKRLEEQAMAIVKESFEQAITGITSQELLFSREIIIKLLNNII